MTHAHVSLIFRKNSGNISGYIGDISRIYRDISEIYLNDLTGSNGYGLITIF